MQNIQSGVPGPIISKHRSRLASRSMIVTGLSGSGKSSLAFDTIYAEGQRRYVESLSTYARQFLSMMEKPDIDTIEGLSPAISIEQNPPRTTRAQRWARSRKSTTTCVAVCPCGPTRAARITTSTSPPRP